MGGYTSHGPRRGARPIGQRSFRNEDEVTDGITGVTSRAVLIGKSGSMMTRLSGEECGERLRPAMRGFMSGSRADSSGFRLARGRRTAIRIRGTFVPRPEGGTVVEYRVEFLPAALLLLAVTTPLSFLVLGVGFWLAHQSVWDVWPLLPIWVLVVAANVWISDRQGHWLLGFVRHRLEASEPAPSAQLWS
jgi:hypothetical protein